MDLIRFSLFLFLLSIVCINCTTSNFDEQVIGDYTIEDYENLKTGEYNYPYQVLSLNKDHVFILRKVLNNEKVSGTWKILEKKDSIILIEFVVVGSKVAGNLSGNFLHIEYPNDLYGDKFLRLKYLKLANRIDRTKSNPFNAALDECNCYKSWRNTNIQKHRKHCDSILSSKYYYYRVYIENEELLYTWNSRLIYKKGFANYDSIDIIFNKKGLSKPVRDSAFWFGQKVFDIGITECELK